ncbi:MAG TPA: transcriptional regulator [Planctomycetales bacterium]|jgi:ribosome-binding protein aMBF1 (putative translation factor)|nr:transcriptional regulator [Planctomycetales bacterium]
MANKTKRPPTTDALEILRRRYVEGRPEMHALVEQERANAKIAQAIYDLRTSLGLSQREFAKRVKTSASVICRLEDAEYEGHSTGILERIASALDQTLQMEVRFVSKKAAHSSTGKSKV